MTEKQTHHTTRAQTSNLFKESSFTPRNEIKAILWDVDGTLVNSEPLFQIAIVEWTKKQGHEMDEAFIASWLAKTAEDTFDIICKKFAITDQDFTSFLNELIIFMTENFKKIPLMSEKLPQILKHIQDKGIRQAVVSNGQKELVSKSVDVVGREFFEFDLAIEETIEGKPAPTPYLMAAKKMGLDPKNCIAIEDSATGVASALAAGMHVIASPSNDNFIKLYSSTFQSADLVVRSIDDVDWDTILK